MTITEAQQLKAGDRIHYGPTNATVVRHDPRGEIEIEWDHGARQIGRHRRLWMFEVGEHN